MNNCQLNKFTAGFAQIDIEFMDVAENKRKVVEIIRRRRFDLLVFPELVFSGYEIPSRRELKKVSMNLNDSVFEEISSICRADEKAVIFGFAEIDGNGIYNSSMMINEKGERYVYRKMHLFNLEKKIFDKGDRGFFVNRVKNDLVGQLICFDWFFPEASRTLSLLGADIIALSANLVMPYCQKAMVTRSLENRVYSIVANRIGKEKETIFTGRSRIISPSGIVLKNGFLAKECIMTAEIDLQESKDKHVNKNNDLFKDRRGVYYVL